MIQRGKVAVRRDQARPDPPTWRPTKARLTRAIANNVSAGTSTVYRTKLHFVEERPVNGLSRSPKQLLRAIDFDISRHTDVDADYVADEGST